MTTKKQIAIKKVAPEPQILRYQRTTHPMIESLIQKLGKKTLFLQG